MTLILVGQEINDTYFHELGSLSPLFCPLFARSYDASSNVFSSPE